MQIVACGSRNYTDREAVRRALLSYWPDPDCRGFEVLHGAARGADTLAAEEAGRFGARTRAFPADWRRYGRAAGPVRTRQMLDESPDLMLAFGTGRGTDFAVAEAERRGIPVRRIP